MAGNFLKERWGEAGEGGEVLRVEIEFDDEC